MKTVSPWACCLISLFLAQPGRADIAEAENAAWRMGVKYRDRGFYLHDVNVHGFLLKGKEEYLHFELQVVKGLDYVFLTALDVADKIGVRLETKEVIKTVLDLEDIDLFVYSDVGQEIVSDTRPTSNGMAGVQFRAEYTGQVDIYLQLYVDETKYKNPRPVGYYVLVGHRGSAYKAAPEAPFPSSPPAPEPLPVAPSAPPAQPVAPPAQPVAPPAPPEASK